MEEEEYVYCVHTGAYANATGDEDVEYHDVIYESGDMALRAGIVEFIARDLHHKDEVYRTDYGTTFSRYRGADAGLEQCALECNVDITPLVEYRKSLEPPVEGDDSWKSQEIIEPSHLMTLVDKIPYSVLYERYTETKLVGISDRDTFDLTVFRLRFVKDPYGRW